MKFCYLSAIYRIKRYYIYDIWLLWKIENYTSWVDFIHFREKTHLLALELIFFQLKLATRINKNNLMNAGVLLFIPLSVDLFVSTYFLNDLKLINNIEGYCSLFSSENSRYNTIGDYSVPHKNFTTLKSVNCVFQSIA